MKVDSLNNEEHSKMLSSVSQREKQERIAAATLTSETLSSLQLSIDGLPQKCQQLLKDLSERQSSLGIEQMDPIAISQQQTNETSQQLTEEYELLELRQKNVELQRQIDANKKFLEDLKREMASCKTSLERQSPNPDNIQEVVRQMKQKLASYEEICEKAKIKFSRLNVPEGVLPQSLAELAERLAALKAEEGTLRQRADDITLARQARETLNKLRR